MPPIIERQHIDITPNVCGGKPRIAGHRIRVQDIVIWTEQGRPADQIVSDFPQLSLADVYAALAYYYDHRQEIDRQIREDDEFAAQMKAQHTPGLLDQLRAKNAGADSYHLDEHVDRAVAEGLRQRGLDVTTTMEAGLSGVSDEEQLHFATTNGRVLVTRDRHFLVLHNQGVPHAGIVFWHSKRRNLGQIILDLVLLWRAIDATGMLSRVEYL